MATVPTVVMEQRRKMHFPSPIQASEKDQGPESEMLQYQADISKEYVLKSQLVFLFIRWINYKPNHQHSPPIWKQTTLSVSNVLCIDFQLRGWPEDFQN